MPSRSLAECPRYIGLTTGRVIGMEAESTLTALLSVERLDLRVLLQSYWYCARYCLDDYLTFEMTRNLAEAVRRHAERGPGHTALPGHDGQVPIPSP